MDALSSSPARKRVLVLMADYGYGHRRAAEAVAKALRQKHGQECTVQVVNPLNDPRAPRFLRAQQANYDRVVRERPGMHEVGYQVSELPLAANLIESAMTLLLSNVLREILRRHRPDVIVSTYMFYAPILSALLTNGKVRIPLVTVVIDLASTHELWFRPGVDLCLVPDQRVFEAAVRAGMSPKQVAITGIPVDPDMATDRDELASLRQYLGWRPDAFTVLAVGSKRVGRLYESALALDRSPLPIQLAVVAGGDDDLFRRLTETPWKKEAHLYNFVKDMAPLTRAADCVLSKAGPQAIAESLACGLPMILVNFIPGQETGNAELVVNEAAADWASDPSEVPELVGRWMADGMALYRERASNARRIGMPNAAAEVAERVYRLAVEAAPEVRLSKTA